MPKPVLPLVDRPFISYMIDWLARHGVDDVVMACGFWPTGCARRSAEATRGQRIRYVVEPDPRGTAGAIKFSPRSMLDDRFLVLNGDVLTDLDLTALMEQHDAQPGRGRRSRSTRSRTRPAYGLVRRDEDGEITEFLEKPDPEEIDTTRLNAGAYVLERAVLELIAARQGGLDRARGVPDC